MFKRVLSLSVVFLLTFTSAVSINTSKVLAYQNNSYYSNVRIGLKSMSASSLTVTLNGAYAVNGQVIPAGTVLTLSVGSSGVIYNGTSYTSISFMPQDVTYTISLNNGSKTNQYLGSMSFKVLNGTVLPINSIDIENYLKGVVGIEMSDYFPIDALKAQAVAARNYTLANLGTFSSYGYDLADTNESQAYQGVDTVDKNVIAAVDRTKGEVQLYNDSLVQAYYSASDGGYTEASENVWYTALPYLIAKTDTYESESWPTGNQFFTNTQIEIALKNKGYLGLSDKFVKLDLTTISRDQSGRVLGIDVIYTNSIGSQLRKTLVRNSTKSFLGLPSSLYYVTYNGTAASYTFSGKGFGHGVGMSQMGAKYRAAAGQNYKDILTFYYDGSYTQKLSAQISTLNINKTSTLVGQPVNISASGKNGSGSGYLYKYVISDNGEVVYTVNYTSTSSISLPPAAAGNYTVDVYLKDALSNQVYDDHGVVRFTSYSSPVLSSFTANKTTTLTGQTVSLNAAAKGGSGTGYLYKFVVMNGTTAVLTQDYSSNSTLNYTPDTNTNYNVVVYVKDSISTASYDAQGSLSFTSYALPAVSSFSMDKSSTMAAQPIAFTAAGSGGSGTGFLYKYVVMQNGNVIYTQDYSQNSSLNYASAAAGDYAVNLYLKDAISTADKDAQSSLNFTCYGLPVISSFTQNKTSTMIGQGISFSAAASGGSGTGIQYKYVVSKDGSAVYTQDYSSNAALNYVPQSAGNYTAALYVKDNLSTSVSDTQGTLSFAAYALPQVSAITTAGTMYEKKPVSVTVAAQGGSGTGLVYKYEVYKDTALISTQDFSSNTNYTFTPSVYGNYSVKVYVKDALSTNAYDNTLSSALNILREPVVVSKLPIYWGMKGSDVSQIQNGLTTLGYNVGTIDGIFGSKTYNGVTALQTSAGLKATGTVDQATLDAMNNAIILKLTGIK